jgi:dCTP diphosphatase
MSSLEQLTEAVVRFRDARDWARFHSPKNLVAAVAIEAGELMETLQWVEGPEARKVAAKKKQEIAAEVADVAIYLLLLCRELDINLAEAVQEKIRLNERRYPEDKARGTSSKWDEL